MTKKRTVINWVRAHRRELIIAGVSIAAVIGTILLIKNWTTLKAYLKSLTELIPESGSTTKTAVKAAEGTVKATDDVVKTTSVAVETAHNPEVIPIEVAKHIRNLPDGWHPSPEKVATALDNGVILAEGQTWVDGYWKGRAA